MLEYELLPSKDYMFDCYTRSGWFWTKKGKKAVTYASAKVNGPDGSEYVIDVVARSSHLDNHERKCKCFAFLFIKNKSTNKEGFAIITPHYLIAEFYNFRHYRRVLPRAGYNRSQDDWLMYNTVVRKVHDRDSRITVVMNDSAKPKSSKGFKIDVYGAYSTGCHGHVIKINGHEVLSVESLKNHRSKSKKWEKHYIPCARIESKEMIKKINDLITQADIFYGFRV